MPIYMLHKFLYTHKPIGPTAQKSVKGRLLRYVICNTMYAISYNIELLTERNCDASMKATKSHYTTVLM
jgi:hypothetical protein